jgi:hypothetical protein
LPILETKPLWNHVDWILPILKRSTIEKKNSTVQHFSRTNERNNVV